MPQLVRDDALQLIDVVGRREEAGVDVDRLPGRNEGVDLGGAGLEDMKPGCAAATCP